MLRKVKSRQASSRPEDQLEDMHAEARNIPGVDRGYRGRASDASAGADWHIQLRSFADGEGGALSSTSAAAGQLEHAAVNRQLDDLPLRSACDAA